MTERSYPFVDGRTTDAEFSAMFQHLFPDAVMSDPGGPPLKVTANSGGLKVSVAPGTACVRGHFYASDAATELPIDPNTGSQDRIDVVVLHLEYGSVQSITLRVVQGTPGAGVPPLQTSVADVQQVALAEIKVPAAAVTIPASAVADRRKWWRLELLRKLGIFIQPTAPGDGVLWFETK